MSDRIKIILSAGDSAGLPEIARALALDTDMTPEAAQMVLNAAATDIAAVTANATQTITTPPAGGQNSGAGPFNTLGVPDRIGGDAKADVKASWGRAVELANARF